MWVCHSQRYRLTSIQYLLYSALFGWFLLFSIKMGRYFLDWVHSKLTKSSPDLTECRGGTKVMPGGKFFDLSSDEFFQNLEVLTS